MQLQKIDYKKLNSKAKEMYNFHKAAARLADYGFSCMWLSNDWQGADFIAVHADGVTDIKVQLKSRLSFAKKYSGKNIYICFLDNPNIYLYPHDVVLSQIESRISNQTWLTTGTWSTPSLTQENKKILSEYLL